MNLSEESHNNIVNFPSYKKHNNLFKKKHSTSIKSLSLRFLERKDMNHTPCDDRKMAHASLRLCVALWFLFCFVLKRWFIWISYRANVYVCRKQQNEWWFGVTSRLKDVRLNVSVWYFWKWICVNKMKRQGKHISFALFDALILVLTLAVALDFSFTSSSSFNAYNKDPKPTNVCVHVRGSASFSISISILWNSKCNKYKWIGGICEIVPNSWVARYK